MPRTREETDETLNMINELVDSGILGSEQCPDPNYWHWPVLQPDRLPDWIRSNYNHYGEIRFYW